MTPYQEAVEFAELSQRRQLKRFFEITELPSGFYLPGEFATKPGREVLVQTRDFEEQST